MPNQTIKFRAVEIPINSGSDPDIIEIDDCTEALGDWPDITEPCTSNESPAGQCEYSFKDEFTRCLYCGRASGLDR